MTPGCVKEEEQKPSTEYKKEEYKPKEEEYKPSTEYKKEEQKPKEEYKPSTEYKKEEYEPKEEEYKPSTGAEREGSLSCAWRKLHKLFCSLFLPPAQQQHQKEKGEEPFFAKGTPSSQPVTSWKLSTAEYVAKEEEYKPSTEYKKVRI